MERDTVTRIRWVVTGLLTLILLLAACSPNQPKQTQFPDFVYGSALSLESYKAAVALPQEVITAMPCYCGCADLPQPHTSLKDCFIKADGSYTDHAAGCDLCGKIAIDVLNAHQQGEPLKDIRAAIDAKYAVYGNPTKTPPVP